MQNAYVFILVAFLFGLQRSTNDQPYDLKGEAPGITLKQFRGNHKLAECSNRTTHQVSCRVYDGVSFAGIAAATHKGCATLECDTQGILAQFFDGRLVSLTYGVMPGSSKQIVTTLKTKFGEPSEAGETSVKWRNSVGYLSVSEVSVPSGSAQARNVATAITSALNDIGQTKDI